MAQCLLSILHELESITGTTQQIHDIVTVLNLRDAEILKMVPTYHFLM